MGSSKYVAAGEKDLKSVVTCNYFAYLIDPALLQDLWHYKHAL